jgi:uncharacterized membrane protein
MESNLRPLTLSEILDRTAQLYRENFLLFAGIFAVYAGIALVLSMPLLFAFPGFKPQQASNTPQLVAFFLVFGAISLLLFVFYGAATAAITRAVAWVHLGEPATVRRAYTTTLPRLGRYMWLKCITGFMIFLVLFACVMILAILAVAVAAALARNRSSMAGVVTAIVLLMYIPSGFLAFWMALRYSLAIPASVVENLKARQAIKRSIEMTKGSRGRIFLLWLLVGVVWIALFGITHSFFFIYSAMHRNTLPIGLSILEQILTFFMNTFVGPILATGTTLFYYDQRVRKEGYDIEWMMQAAGLTVPDTPSTEGPAPSPSRP